MSHTTAFRVLTLILILGDLESITVVNHHPDEEYFLEHEVLCEEAITEAKKLQLYPGRKFTHFALDTKSVTHAKPLVRLHSNVWSIKHLYEAPKSIYLSSENNLPLIRLNGYLGHVHLPRINSTNCLVLLISSLSCHFAAGTDKKGIRSIRTIVVLI